MLYILPVLLLLERFYFYIADRFNIIDKPNQRSSHAYITRRGGGIIFPVAWLIYAASTGFEYPWFTLGLLLISAISFMDDLSEVAVGPRISTHALALFFAFYDLGVMDYFPWWGMVMVIIFSIAILNAVNFMDGINGITSMYALVFFALLSFNSGLQGADILFDLNSPYTYIISSLLVFTFFNFRKKALCFAGDVGSVSIAYLMIGTLITQIFPSPNNQFAVAGTFSAPGELIDLKFLLLLSVYGVDSLLTIVHRLILKENILKGHRKHLYQYMANEAGVSHLAVSSLYAVSQLVISIWILNNDVSLSQGVGIIVFLSAVYVLSKWAIMRQYSTQPANQQAQLYMNPNSSAVSTSKFVSSRPSGPVKVVKVEPGKKIKDTKVTKKSPSYRTAEAN